MNEIIASLHSRKSVRVFTEEPISDAAKRAIIEAAVQAPTAGNQQLYTILDITDQSLKDKLAVSCDNQPFIAEAPLVLIFCADAQKWYDLFVEVGANPREAGVGDMMLAFLDATIAAQNAVVAAESLGIGSCYIGDILEQYEVHREMLNLPDYVVPAAMLVFGYPAPSQIERKKPERCALSDVVCENTYTRKSGDELRTMFDSKKGVRTLEEWAQAFCKRKYNSDFSIEMTRSVGEYIKNFKG
jgi:nitroreductase